MLDEILKRVDRALDLWEQSLENEVSKEEVSKEEVSKEEVSKEEKVSKEEPVSKNHPSRKEIKDRLDATGVEYNNKLSTNRLFKMMLEAEKPEAEKPEAEKPEAEKSEAEKPEAEKSEEDINIDDVRAALNAYAKRTDMKTAVALLKDIGDVNRLPDLDPQLYGDVIRACEVES